MKTSASKHFALARSNPTLLYHCQWSGHHHGATRSLEPSPIRPHQPTSPSALTNGCASCPRADTSTLQTSPYPLTRYATLASTRDSEPTPQIRTARDARSGNATSAEQSNAVPVGSLKASSPLSYAWPGTPPVTSPAVSRPVPEVSRVLDGLVRRWLPRPPVQLLLAAHLILETGRLPPVANSRLDFSRP